MTDERLQDKLRKILALTNSPEEGEAQAAAEHLQRLLTMHNLSIADLERRGQTAPKLRKEEHDLGKAAFTWKLDLAETIAEHYYCWPLVDRRAKTVAFVGRPDNVESLQMLYAWIIDQIKRISAEERRNHWVRTNEHIDPLRWQVNFGVGAVQRLRSRLYDLKQQQAADQTITALVVHHRSEISDWLEEHMGYRVDGRDTKDVAAWRKKWEAQQAELEQLKLTDIEEYYRRCPWERPEYKAKMEAEEEKRRKKEAANRRRRDARRAERGYRERELSPEQERKEEEAYRARITGRDAADRINLQPFLKDGRKPNAGELE